MSIRSSCGEAFRGHFPEKHSSNRSNFIPLAVPFTWCHCGCFPGLVVGAPRSLLLPTGHRKLEGMWDSCTHYLHRLTTASPRWTPLTLATTWAKVDITERVFFSSVVNDKFEKSWRRHKTQTHWQFFFLLVLEIYERHHFDRSEHWCGSTLHHQNKC